MTDPKDANRDPLTDEPGAHPVGTGVGAAGGALAGAAAGALAGPIGAAIGGIAGAVMGGLAGKAAAETVNPTAEDAYWRESYQNEPYYTPGRSYDEYRPAYELGWSSSENFDGDFTAVEPRLSRDWGTARGTSPLDWEQARPATQAAWERARTRRQVPTGTAVAADAADATRSHPVGTGVGVAGGAMAGAAVGSVAGPIGTVVGGVAGAVMGGYAGDAAAEAVNPTAEDAYWRDSYQREPYFTSGRTYDEYRPAYELGWSSVGRYEGDFASVEPQLSRDWSTARGTSTLDWQQARPATQAAWERARRHGNTHSGATPILTNGATLNGTTRNGEVVQVLDDLLECSRDGEYGFRASAERADNPELKQILLRHAEECARAAAELEREVRAHGGEPSSGGTVAGAMHRGWVSVKTALSVDDDQAVLNECERGEDAALARYRKALKATLPPNVRTLVERQAQGVQRNHDEIKALRDRYQAAS